MCNIDIVESEGYREVTRPGLEYQVNPSHEIDKQFLPKNAQMTYDNKNLCNFSAIATIKFSIKKSAKSRWETDFYNNFEFLTQSLV